MKNLMWNEAFLFCNPLLGVSQVLYFFLPINNLFYLKGKNNQWKNSYQCQGNFICPSTLRGFFPMQGPSQITLKSFWSFSSLVHVPNYPQPPVPKLLSRTPGSKLHGWLQKNPCSHTTSGPAFPPNHMPIYCPLMYSLSGHFLDAPTSHWARNPRQ